MDYSYGRSKANYRLLLGRHLIYAEGTKTEPNYAENIKAHIDQNRLVTPRYDGIHIHRFAHGLSTNQLLEKVEEDVQKRKAKNETIDYIWVFLDKDSFPDFDSACAAIENKNLPKYKNNDGLPSDPYGARWECCWSNESFEVWLYLHYENLVTSLNRKDYIPKINEFIKNKGHKGKLDKDTKNLYDFLIINGGDPKKAIRFAETLDTKNNHSMENPSTGVYKFMKYFIKYI